MGNAKSKRENSHVESMLIDTYQNTDLEFTYKEITNFKLRIHDSENYFNAKFDFFLFFNNYLFRERLSTLYDNFNIKIEKFSQKKPGHLFKVLIDFDDETETILRGNKVDFDSLFTIIFEKLEINIILFFDLTNTCQNYIKDFFIQLVESVDLYKYNRKFDCLYFLLPNTDYFIKNDCGIMYLTNKNIIDRKFFEYDTKDFKFDKIDKTYMKAIFENINNKLLNSRYATTNVNNYIDYFFEKVNPTFIRLNLLVNFDTEVESLVINNEDQFKLIESVSENCECYICSINIDNTFNFDAFLGFLKKTIKLIDSSKKNETIAIFKLISKGRLPAFKSHLKIEWIVSHLENIILKMTDNKGRNYKRKMIIELNEIKFPMLQSGSHTSRSYIRDEESNMQTSAIMQNSQDPCDLRYERLYCYWYLENPKEVSVGLECLIKKYGKLNNPKILRCIRDYLFKNFVIDYKEEESEILQKDINEILI